MNKEHLKTYIQDIIIAAKAGLSKPIIEDQDDTKVNDLSLTKILLTKISELANWSLDEISGAAPEESKTKPGYNYKIVITNTQLCQKKIELIKQIHKVGRPRLNSIGLKEAKNLTDKAFSRSNDKGECRVEIPVSLTKEEAEEGAEEIRNLKCDCIVFVPYNKRDTKTSEIEVPNVQIVTCPVCKSQYKI